MRQREDSYAVEGDGAEEVVGLETVIGVEGVFASAHQSRKMVLGVLGQ